MVASLDRVSVRTPLFLWWVVLTGCSTLPQPISPAFRPAPVAIETTLLLIGDAGEPTDRDPVLAALEREVSTNAASTTVVFLGDNIYPDGLPESTAPARRALESRLDEQVTAAGEAGRVYFIPGNHDWASHGDDGWDAILRQGRYLAENGEARLLPENGCPGPAVVDLGSRVRLILIDTQWWLHDGPRPGPESSCDAATLAELSNAVMGAIQSASDRHVIVAGHHPLESSGPHGGRFGWLDHLFPLRPVAKWAWLPLPVIGSAYPIARKSGVLRQDLSSPRYTELRAALETAFSDVPPLVYVAGHEHSLEVHRGPGARYTLVSGAGSSGEMSKLRPKKGTVFAVSADGFMRLDVYRDGRVQLAVITVDEGGDSRDAWVQWLD